MKAESNRASFYRAGIKRTFDLLMSLIGLVALLPLFLIIALWVKLTSRGPVFYRQERVGRRGRSFQIVKFRTMEVNTDRRGPAITAWGDVRITAAGRILRFTKLDELPQLWNVVKGEMSLVGPRPESSVYVKDYTPHQRIVLTVRPGMTDAATIAYRREEELLAAQENPEGYYRNVILPHKLALNEEYIRDMSFQYDLLLLIKTVVCVFAKRTDLSPMKG